MDGLRNNLSFHRLAGEAAFDAGAAADVSALHGALNRSYALRHRLRNLQQAQAWQRAALDALSFPVMVVDAACGVLQANRAAESWLSEPDVRYPPGAWAPHGRLCCTSSGRP